MKKMAIAIGLLQALIYCCFLLEATSLAVGAVSTSGQVLQRFENPSTPIRKLAEEAVRLDMNALLEFKRGIVKDPDGVLEDWNETKNHCQWNGVTCDNQTTRVVGLNLTSVYNQITQAYEKQIFGTLGSSLSQLSELKSLILRRHNLTGEIPAQFGRLSFLHTIDLHGNNLTGEIPIELSSCGELQELYIGANNLTGELPIQLAQCSSLKKIDVSSNRFTGIISPEFGRLQNLTVFLAMYNNFHGTIPASFGNCSKLVALALNDNNLTGTIPTSLANCSELQGFLIQYNNISGSIPPAMASLQKLSIFYVYFNQLEGDLNFLQNCSAIWQVHAENNNLSGQLPRFGNCSSLTHFVVTNNKFSGIIPPSWGECPILEVLVLSNNVELTGPLPPELFALPPGKLQRLRTLSIYNTKVYGSIPSNLGTNFPNLTSIILYNNRLTGQVPTTLGSCSKLQLLMLGNNRLDGEFAVDMSNMSQLQTLSLANNSITGDVSTFFSGLPTSGNLSVLDISRNLFKGELPSTSYLSPFFGLKVLVLGHNQLEGSLPSWLWNLPKLQVMDISNNHLHGLLPEDFSNLHGYMDTNGNEDSQLGNTDLTDTTLYNQNLVLTIGNTEATYSSILSVLTSVDLSSNELTGKISTNISQLLKLQYLNLSRNVFGGEIPQTIGQIPLQQLDLSNNVLVGEIPQGLGSQSALSSLELANNSLSGPIPTGQQISSFEVGTFIPGNDGLCGPPLPVSRSCQGSEAREPLLSAFVKPAGLVLGSVVGFVSVAGIFLCWGPAQKFILLDKLRIHGRGRVHNEAVGLWRPPVQPKL